MFSFRRYFDPSWGVSSPRKCCLTFYHAHPLSESQVPCLQFFLCLFCCSLHVNDIGAHAQKASPQALVHNEYAIHGEKTSSTRCPCRNRNLRGAVNLHVCNRSWISGSRSCVIQTRLINLIISFHPFMLLYLLSNLQ